MASLRLVGADLDIEMDVGPHSITFTFEGSPDISGTWVGKVRTRYGAASTTLDFSSVIDDSAAATGTIVVDFTEVQLASCVATGEDKFRGVYTLERDDVPYWKGQFVVNQKASR